MFESYVRTNPRRALEFLIYMEDRQVIHLIFHEPIQRLFQALCEQ